jgi:hypothetical protein
MQMTAIELKKILVHRITEIDDIAFLNAVKTILDTKVQSQVLILTQEQRTDIDESRKEIENGLFFEQEELDQEFEKWLSLK